MARASLVNLPYEPLLQVLLLLSIDDIKRIRLVRHFHYHTLKRKLTLIAKVNRCLYVTSESVELWQSLVKNLQSSGRELTMDPAWKVELLHLREVKQAILRTSALACHWRSGSSQHTNRPVNGGQSNSRLLKLHPANGGRIGALFLSENLAFFHSGGFVLCYSVDGKFIVDIKHNPVLDKNVLFLFDDNENALYTFMFGSPNPFIEYVLCISLSTNKGHILTELTFQNAYHQIRDRKNGQTAEIIQYLLLEFTWEMGRARVHYSL